MLQECAFLPYLSYRARPSGTSQNRMAESSGVGSGCPPGTVNTPFVRGEEPQSTWKESVLAEHIVPVLPGAGRKLGEGAEASGGEA